MKQLAPRIAAADLLKMQMVQQFTNEENRNYDSAVFLNAESRFVVVTKFVHAKTRMTVFESRLITDDKRAALQEAEAHTFGSAA